MLTPTNSARNSSHFFSLSLGRLIHLFSPQWFQKTLAGNPLRASLLDLRETLQACFLVDASFRLIFELGF